MANHKVETPPLIKWAARLLFGGIVLSMAQVFSPETRRLGDFYPALFGLVISLRFIAGVGIWHMKRWGVELFMITFAGTAIMVFLIPTLEFNPIGLVFYIVALGVFMAYYPKMDRNL